MLTKVEIDKITESMRLGVDLEIATHAVGANLSEVFEWLERGKIEESKLSNGHKADRAEAKYLSFWKAVKTARASAIAQVQMNIRAAIADDWKAGAWWLEKQMPEKYGKNAGQFNELQTQLKEIEQHE